MASASVPWAVLFYCLGGWGWVFWGICSRVAVSVFGHWAIGYFAHNKGNRSWHVVDAAVQGYNIPWTALITMGESWPNNHHAFPESARIGLKKGQCDPAYRFIQILGMTGLASNIGMPRPDDQRDDLRRTV